VRKLTGNLDPIPYETGPACSGPLSAVIQSMAASDNGARSIHFSSAVEADEAYTAQQQDQASSPSLSRPTTHGSSPEQMSVLLSRLPVDNGAGHALGSLQDGCSLQKVVAIKSRESSSGGVQDAAPKVSIIPASVSAPRTNLWSQARRSLLKVPDKSLSKLTDR
jgi:hypothetical protein